MYLDQTVYILRGEIIDWSIRHIIYVIAFTIGRLNKSSKSYYLSKLLFAQILRQIGLELRVSISTFGQGGLQLLSPKQVVFRSTLTP